MKKLKGLLFLLLIIGACTSSNNNKSSIEKFYSSLDSSGFSVYLGTTIEKSKVFEKFITADLESDQVASEIGVDAADDPAIWYNKENPEKSLVLGTNKHGGIHVYNMDGVQTQYIEICCINNIDLRDNFKYNDQDVVIVAATNCTLNTISMFYIDKQNGVLSDSIYNIKTDIELVYGICMYQSNETGKYYVFVNGERGDVEQWEVTSEKEKINAELVRSFKVSSRPEGMVADDIEGVLFIGVEEEGIIKVKAEPQFDFETIWVTGSNPSDRTFISSDIEGIAIFKNNGKTYLIASSQGNFSYPIFEIGNPDRYIASFVIKDGIIDGAEETDGLEIVDKYFSDKFPNGVLIVQDGFNFKNDTLQPQNFKYISLDKIFKLIKQN